jgi:hypothetical protein
MTGRRPHTRIWICFEIKIKWFGKKDLIVSFLLFIRFILFKTGRRPHPRIHTRPADGPTCEFSQDPPKAPPANSHPTRQRIHILHLTTNGLDMFWKCFGNKNKMFWKMFRYVLEIKKIWLVVSFFSFILLIFFYSFSFFKDRPKAPHNISLLFYQDPHANSHPTRQ